MLILHAADIHLGKRQYALKDREEDFYTAFNEMVEAALRERVEAVLISGDLFDSPVPSTTMKPFKVAVEGIKRLKENGIEVFMIPGDHDYPKIRGYPAIGYLSELTGAKLLRGEKGAKGVEYKGFEFHGVEAPAPGRLAPLEYLKKVKPSKNSVLLLHVGLCNVFPFNCLDESKVPQGYKYYALGHIHKPLKFYLYNSLATYPGSLEITSVDDVFSFKWEGNKKEGPVLVDLSGDEATLVGRIKVYSRRQVVLKYELPKEFQKALKDASSVPLGAIVHLTLVGRPSRETVKTIVSQFSSRALTVRVDVKNTKTKAEEEEKVVKYVSLEDALIEFYGKELGAMLAELVRAAQEGSSAEVKAVVTKIFESGAWRRAPRASRRPGLLR